MRFATNPRLGETAVALAEALRDPVGARPVPGDDFLHPADMAELSI